MGNASFGSARTAATSLLGSIDETCLREHDSDDDSILLWEGLEDSFLLANSSSKINLPAHKDDDDSSEASLDFHDLQRHYTEPFESFHE